MVVTNTSIGKDAWYLLGIPYKAYGNIALRRIAETVPQTYHLASTPRHIITCTVSERCKWSSALLAYASSSKFSVLMVFTQALEI